MHYDYIIAGAGASGLSLLMRMMNDPFFDDKQILVVDKSTKKANDRTWCFWEKGSGFFEHIVFHQWNKVHFYSDTLSELIDLGHYSYKMIRGIDLYQHVIQQAVNKSNVTFCFDNIHSVGTENNVGFVVVGGKRYTADFVFNSIIFSPPIIPTNKYYLLQHFKGYIIETSEDVFKPDQATLMDFRISQEHGAAFVYVLPRSSKKALVEYTLFTKELLTKQQYDDGLKSYINNFLGIRDYQIVEEEFGIIPMTNIAFEKHNGKVINMGTAGGQTKGSSGYTFRFIQKHADNIVDSLLRYGHPFLKDKFYKKRFSFYDSTLLNILAKDKYPLDAIFSKMFQSNSIESVLRFLDNESSFQDELKIMSSLPKLVFTKAALEQIFK